MIELWVYLTNACNLKCLYCYQHKKVGRMNTDVGREIINWIVPILKERKIRGLTMNFYGGEPLLNFPVMKDTIEYGTERFQENNLDIRFYVITNGILLTDKILDFGSQYNVSFQLSIDGDRATHDKYRKNPKGEGSFDMLGGEEGIKKKADSACVKGVYLTYTPDTVQSLYDNILYLVNQGFRTLQFFPVLENEWEGKEPLLEKQIELLADLFFENFTKNSNSLTLSPIDYMLVHTYINERPELKKVFLQNTRCKAGRKNFTIDTYGFIYPCSRIPDDISIINGHDFRIGNVFGGIYNPEVLVDFRQWLPRTSAECICSKCEFSIICFYQCFGSNLGSNKDKYKPNKNCCIITKSLAMTINSLYKKLWNERHEAFIKYLKRNVKGIDKIIENE